MKKIHLGVMVRYNTSNPPFIEKYFMRAISIYGQRVGIDVTIFSPRTVLWKQKLVMGYRYNQKTKQWIKGTYPIPEILYDRIAYSNRRQIPQYHPLIQRLTTEYKCTLLGRGLPGKWHVYNMLKDIEILQPFLPETMLLSDFTRLKHILEKHKALFFKPASGSHGKGVFKCSLTKDGIQIKGRNNKNMVFRKRFLSLANTHRWIKKFTEYRKYVVQPYLELSTAQERPFDIRILLQKNHEGVWTETGRAARVGKKATLTSNLDGGGTARDADVFLRRHFSPEQVKRINHDIQLILTHLPSAIEEKHGHLVELGIDIGIDRKGHTWILELNSKPGRKSFMLSHNKKAFLSSLITPVQYANYVVSQSGGR